MPWNYVRYSHSCIFLPSLVFPSESDLNSLSFSVPLQLSTASVLLLDRRTETSCTWMSLSSGCNCRIHRFSVHHVTYWEQFLNHQFIFRSFNHRSALISELWWWKFGVIRGSGVELENAIEFLKNALSVSLTFIDARSWWLEPGRDPSSDVFWGLLIPTVSATFLVTPFHSGRRFGFGSGPGCRALVLSDASHVLFQYCFVSHVQLSPAACIHFERIFREQGSYSSEFTPHPVVYLCSLAASPVSLCLIASKALFMHIVLYL